MYPVTYLVRQPTSFPASPNRLSIWRNCAGSGRRRWHRPADRARLLGYMRDMRKVASINPAQESAATAEPAVEQLPDFAAAIPAANVAAGQETAQLACNAMSGTRRTQQDRPRSLRHHWRPRASHPGFDYSSAMTAKGGT